MLGSLFYKPISPLTKLCARSYLQVASARPPLCYQMTEGKKSRKSNLQITNETRELKCLHENYMILDEHVSSFNYNCKNKSREQAKRKRAKRKYDKKINVRWR